MTDRQLVIETGFKPLLGEHPKVLILGTMPSVQSLNSQQYYGHPRNAFWWIMSQLCSFDNALSYPEKVSRIIKHNIAVWDVVASCHRPGSLDSRIDQSTVTANHLAQFLTDQASIRLIGFNGQAAEKLFKKFINDANWQGDKLILPSTSPANAVLSKEQKLIKWSQIKPYIT